MDSFENKVAVITGGASGIGLGMATVFARAGMKLVLADVEEDALNGRVSDFLDHGTEVIGVRTDVADRDSMFALAEKAKARFGNVHVLCNNAGVGGATGGGQGIWNAPPESWQWVMGVNFMGVVHGLQAFVPDMIAHGESGHIVNTSSVLGVWGGSSGIYGVSKHAVTALTEVLFHDLKQQGAQLGVSVLLPALTATRINTAARNRPDALKPGGQDLDERVMAFMQQMEDRYLRDGMSPVQVGEIVLEAVQENRFYVFTHPGTTAYVENRMRAILEGKDPDRGPPGGP